MNCVYCGKELKGMKDARMVDTMYFTPAGKPKTARGPACLDLAECEKRTAAMPTEPADESRQPAQ